jgi:outer membrane biosynthesis protein TonB
MEDPTPSTGNQFAWLHSKWKKGEAIPRIRVASVAKWRVTGDELESEEFRAEEPTESETKYDSELDADADADYLVGTSDYFGPSIRVRRVGEQPSLQATEEVAAPTEKKKKKKKKKQETKEGAKPEKKKEVKNPRKVKEKKHRSKRELKDSFAENYLSKTKFEDDYDLGREVRLCEGVSVLVHRI